MPSTTEPRPSNRRKTFAGLVLTALVLAGLYSAGWVYFARALETGMTRQIADLARHDVTARCENPTTDGYPFDIGIRCDSVAWQRRAPGISVTAGAFRSQAPVYNPRAVAGAVDGPAYVDLPGLEPLEVSWQALTAGARLAAPLPDMLSLKGRGIRIARRAEAASAPLATLDTSRTVIHRNGEAIDIAMAFRRLRSAIPLPTGGHLPDLDGTAEVRFPHGSALLDATLGPPRARLRGQSGQIEHLTLSLADAGISMTGPFDIARDGRIDARLSVTVHNPDKLVAAFRDAAPGLADQISAIAGLVRSLNIGNGPLTVRLDIRRGRVFAGFIPLGVVPAI
jgi:hypothetical protein